VERRTKEGRGCAPQARRSPSQGAAASAESEGAGNAGGERCKLRPLHARTLISMNNIIDHVY